jgi:glucose/mannose-6-phosphate isomerase
MLPLDDADRRQQLDPSGYARLIDALPEHLTLAWALAQTLDLPPRASQAGLVLATGRGDSAIAADIARHCALFRSRVPIVVWHDAELPAFVSDQTMVLAISHSGTTQTVVELADAARARGANVLAITTGGQLAELDGVHVWRYRTDGDSRLALGWQSVLAVAALAKLGCLPDPAADIAETVSALSEQRVRLTPDSPIRANPAKRLAGQLLHRQTALFVVDELAPAGRRWASMICQLAHARADCFPLTDFDHIAAGGMFPEDLITKTMALFLRGTTEAGSSTLRSEAAKMAFLTAGYNIDQVSAIGGSRLAQMLTLSHYGEYVAYYLALCYGVDPALTLSLETHGSA